MKTLNVKFKNVDGTVLKETVRTLKEEHADHSLRDFAATTADIAAGGNGAPINGVPAVSGDKFRFDLWRSFSEETRNLVKYGGKFYIESTLA
jgi:hypothetical protein